MLLSINLKDNYIIYSDYCDNINEKYIDNLINDKKNKILINGIDDNLNNITSFIIFRKIILKKEVNYIILLMGVHKEYRRYGYGKILLDEFIEYIKNSKTNKPKNIILHSLESSEEFFLNYGFLKIKNSRFIKNYEGWKSNNDHLVYRLKIT